MSIRQFFLLHLKPNRVPRSAIRLTHTFGLGGSALVLFTLLALSGMLLMLVYEASPSGAYESVRNLYTQYLFGGLVRNVHYWSANLLFAVVVLHLLRVFYTGAFHGPRRVNWIIGVGLLFSVMAFSFTGYLLPWDQLAFWAVTICTRMLGYAPGIGEGLQHLVRGGAEIGPKTLVMFYAFHTSLIPILVMVLMGFHFWRVRKARGVVVPDPNDLDEEGRLKMVPSYPDLLLRELVVGLIFVALVLMLAVFCDAPLGESANSGMSPNPSKAPWYFIGFQELQLHFHPLLAVVVLPLIVTVAVVMIPYLRYGSQPNGPWFLNPGARRVTLMVAVFTLIAVPALVVVDELWLKPSTGAPSLFGRGMLPLAAMAGLVVGISGLLSRWLRLSRAETVQALFTLFFVALVVLTGVGVWFRGEGMALMTPWGGQ
jgi:quinol-cytochrome oxidoreductase complex cytochrome b subunit